MINSITVKRLCVHGLMFAAICAAPVACGAFSRLYPSPTRPWERTVRTLADKGAACRDDILDLGWNGHANGITTPGRKIPLEGGGTALEWRFTVNHRDGSAYPIGWPNFEVFPKEPLDFTAGPVFSFRARLASKIGRRAPFRLVVSGGQDGKQLARAHFTDVSFGEWREFHLAIGGADWTKTVKRLHFYAEEGDFCHGDEVVIQFKDFRLGESVQRIAGLDPGEAGVSLWVGERGDGDSRAVLLESGTRTLPVLLHVDNRRAAAIPSDAAVVFRIRNVVTGRDALRRVPLGVRVPAGQRAAVRLAVDLSGLAPSYYHALADILVSGESVVGVRKGSDDFLIRRPGESMTSSVLLLRLGMAAWTMDRIHGGFVLSTDISLPHAYDPYDTAPAAYRAFLTRFALTTVKVCEAYEAALPGLALAAEACRRAGDAERLAFAESLLWNAVEAMLTMQDACGGVIYRVNELFVDGLGTGGESSARNGQYSADQTAEWMRGLAYATLYYVRRGGEQGKVRRLNEACLKAGRFLAKYGRWEEEGREDVLQNFSIALTGGTNVIRRLSRQEDRPCDVYQPRVVAGLAFAAIALQKSGERVPGDWWRILDASVAWMTGRMGANGWFDMQCGDAVEGGCHTFLGNIYLGEGLFGVAMANRLAGRESESVIAAARKAYRYVTDDCWVRGRRYQYPLEFWVGPYVYWLFTEWREHVGREPAFEDWLSVLDRRWRQERKWGDFMRMPGMDCGRASSNGTLVLAILGYLGLKDMDERGQAWKLFD